MIILTQQDNSNLKRPCQVAIFAGLRVLLCVMLLLSPATLMAQLDEQVDQQVLESEVASTEEIEVVIVSLPDARQMAQALVTPQLRQQTLLDLAVAANVVGRAEDDLISGNEVDHSGLAQNFLDDRAWLQTLNDRYGWEQPHSGVLDPAAWLMFNETSKQGLQSMPLLYPARCPELF